MAGGIQSKIAKFDELQAKLELKKNLLIEKALKSKNPNALFEAQSFLSKRILSNERKSIIIDPFDLMSSFGYKDKPTSLSYQTLKNMSKAPVINAIIRTRKNQIADFAEPQANKYSTGFKIELKKQFGEPTKEDEYEIERLTEFILNGGENESWNSDDFDTFIRKIVDDSLTYDQMTFEVVENNLGKPVEFFATDASTYRVADTYDDDEEYEYDDEDKRIDGHLPSYVQIYNGEIRAEFYPWELCFGIRNPSTSIYNVGYGVSELEDLVSTVTAMLWAEDYNKRFFSQGSAPKGLLKIKDGKINPKSLEAFRQNWMAMISGVQNAWKTPVVEADVEWINLQMSNKDMEFGNWFEFLIKVATAIYSIDPNEIGFNINSGIDSKALFEGNNEARLKHSKDKGLYPILKFIQRKINKYIIQRLNPRFEFHFVGLDEMTVKEELDMDIQKLGGFQTLNEIREKYGLEKIEDGDVVLNPTYLQSKMQNQMGDEGGFEDENFDDLFGDDNPFLNDNDEDENPFLKSFKKGLFKK